MLFLCMTVKAAIILAHCDAARWGIHPIINVLEDCQFRVSSRVSLPAPDQLCLNGLEEGLDCRVVVTVSLGAHRYLEAVLTQELLIVV